MSQIRYKLRLKGLKTPDGTIPIRTLRAVLDLLLESSERGLRLAVQGESIKRGKPPTWLAKSLDFTVTGLERGSTVLDLEAPELGDTAPDQIRDQDLWYTKPVSEDTALTLLYRTVRDTTAEDLESNTYDAGVLDGLLSFQSLVASFAECVELESPERSIEHFRIAADEIEKIRRLKSCTPEPRALVIAGQFDRIEYARRRFHLVLRNGQSIPGIIDPEFLSVETMRQWWGKKVTVKGMVHFRPSRTVRLLEAQVIKPMAEGDEIFEQVPEPGTTLKLFDALRGQPPQTSALMEVWGKWPGDESIEEILALLKH